MPDRLTIDAIGYGAAALVLATFSVRSMRVLRWTAIASNLAFITYGLLGGLAPVLLLHALLLPVNTWRLVELREADAQFRARADRRTRQPGSRHPRRALMR